MKSLRERRTICNRLGERWYPLAGRRDKVLRAAIGERLRPGGPFLDAGCGPWLGMTRLFASEGRLCVGIDVVPLVAEAAANGGVGVNGNLAALPFRDGSIDVIAMRSVMEHLEDPGAIFHEMARTLRPGGHLVALAPSRWYYASVIGRVLPERLNHALLGFIFGPTVYDNFPTFYRANMPRDVKRAAATAGLELTNAIVCPHPPDYLKFSPALFMLGVAFDRLCGLWRPARALQASWIFILRKPA